MKKHLISLVALIVALPSLAAADTPCGGSQSDGRLSLYCISKLSVYKSTNIETAQFIDFRLKKEGYSRGLGLPGRVKATNITPFIAPIFEYNPDINAGNPNKPLVLGSLTFNGDPEYFRKSGMTFGTAVGFSGRTIYGAGKYLSYTIGASYAHALEHNLGIGRRFGSVCSQNDIGLNYYLDGCLAANTIKRYLSDEETTSASVSLGKIFSSSDATMHFAKFGLKRLYDEDYVQSQATVSLETVSSSSIHSNISITFGGPVDNAHVLQKEVALNIGFDVADRPMTVSLAHSTSGGGSLFGVARDDIGRSITLSYDVSPKFGVAIGYRTVDSTIDYFDENSTTFSLRLTAIEF